MRVKTIEQWIEKISFADSHEYLNELKKLNMDRLISIKPCMPDLTDLKEWREVVFEKWVTK